MAIYYSLITLNPLPISKVEKMYYFGSYSICSQSTLLLMTMYLRKCTPLPSSHTKKETLKNCVIVAFMLRTTSKRRN